MTLPVITLCDTRPEVCDAWRKVFGTVDLPAVTIHNRNIVELSVEAVVSPANSFGFMDGGVDLVYRDFFGADIEKDARHLCRESPGGELLVGQAIVLPTGSSQIGHLILAPTMRVPMVINDPVDVYLATRAAYRVACQWSFRRIAFPGMGTGTGFIDPMVCARCMLAAFEDTLAGPPIHQDLAEAWKRHFNLPLRRLGGQ